MNVLKPMPEMPEAGDRDVVPVDRDTALPLRVAPGARRKTFRMFLVAALIVGGGVAFGLWRHAAAEAEVNATSEQRRSVVPAVRVATVRANDGTMAARLPGSTEAFEQAAIMSRISGYVAKRYVDIGDHVTAGQVLAEISAQELDHQIAQAQATLAQNNAALNQAQANREIASVTWNRDSKLLDKGWVTKQQGDTERLNLQAQEAAVKVAEANIRAQQAQLEVLLQHKSYQRVVAPFDGVVATRNIDAGSLVQADAAGGMPMFTVMHSDVIRIQLYVPQDQAFGLQKGVGAIVRVPEMPGVEFRGTVARVASALQPGTRTLQTEIDVPNREGDADPRHLLRGRAADSAQDDVADRSGGSRHLQPQRPERRRRRERHRPPAQAHRGARPRHHARGQRRGRGRRPGDPQSAGRHQRRPHGEPAAGRGAEGVRCCRRYFDSIHILLSSPGLTGRSSNHRTLGGARPRHIDSAGLLDCPVKPGNDSV